MTQSSVSISIEKPILFLCDLQEKFRPAIKYFNEIIETSNRLIDVCQILEIPLIVTEQYPKGLGRTVSELRIGQTKPLEKTRFSMCTDEVLEQLNSFQSKSIILCGIETHVCVLQTALDLLSREYRVFIVVDAVSSRSMVDRSYGFDQMRQAGAVLTTFESIVLRLVEDASHPKFKQIQSLIRNLVPDTGLVSSTL